MATIGQCAACATGLARYGGSGKNVCSACNKVYCGDCFSLKLKLETSFPANGNTCGSCDHLRKLKKGTNAPEPQAATEYITKEVNENANEQRRSDRFSPQQLSRKDKSLSSPSSKPRPLSSEDEIHTSHSPSDSAPLDTFTGDTRSSMAEAPAKPSRTISSEKASLSEGATGQQDSNLFDSPSYSDSYFNDGYGYDYSRTHNGFPGHSGDESSFLPAHLDEIPYALFLSGYIDEEMLKSIGRKMFSMRHESREMPLPSKGKLKNKNKNLTGVWKQTGTDKSEIVTSEADSVKVSESSRESSPTIDRQRPDNLGVWKQSDETVKMDVRETAVDFPSDPNKKVTRNDIRPDGLKSVHGDDDCDPSESAVNNSTDNVEPLSDIVTNTDIVQDTQTSDNDAITEVDSKVESRTHVVETSKKDSKEKGNDLCRNEVNQSKQSRPFQETKVSDMDTTGQTEKNNFPEVLDQLSIMRQKRLSKLDTVKPTAPSTTRLQESNVKISSEPKKKNVISKSNFKTPKSPSTKSDPRGENEEGKYRTFYGPKKPPSFDNPANPKQRDTYPPKTSLKHDVQQLKRENPEMDKTEAVKSHDKPVVEDDSDSDGDIPIAMQMVKSQKQNTHDPKDEDSGGPLLIVMLGSGSSEPEERKTNKSMKKLHDSDNKSRYTSTMEETDVSFVLCDTKSREKERKVVTVPRDILPSADSMYSAFRRLKESSVVNSLRCTSCRRMDCTGENMQKMKEMIQAAGAEGFEVRDVVPDGNCMFAAVVDQLHIQGNFSFDAMTLREAAVDWLVSNPRSSDGTTFESFLEENWAVYLQGMRMAGQWGDHIALRAVVEVLEQPVKILHANSGASRWTEINPEAAPHYRDFPLHLGLAGEFHYSSLRHTGMLEPRLTQVPSTSSTASLTGDTEECETEGTEGVAVFKDDYIDDIADLSTVHFSFLLQSLIPRKIIDQAAIFSSGFLGGEMEKRGELVGSVAEGVFSIYLHGKSDTSLTILDVHPSLQALYSDTTIGVDYAFVIDDTIVYPGYAMLRTAQSVSSSGNSVASYLSSTPHRSHSASSSMLSQMMSSMALKQTKAIKCLAWPKCALAWRDRVRRENWPSKVVIERVIEEGCHLVPYPHPNSQNPDLEWKFSFACSEKYLFREAVSPDQKYCYMLYTALSYQVLHGLSCFTTDHLKNVFLYACERVPGEYWSTNPGACIMYMFRELVRFIQRKYLPNYFVEANMLEGLLDDKLEEIKDRLFLLQSQPVLFLNKLHDICQYNQIGQEFINRVEEDMPRFKQDRDLKRVSLQVIVPAKIKTAKYFIESGYHVFGLEMLSSAFEERLSVSSCDDSIPYNIFLQGALSELQKEPAVWFVTYADRVLEGQLLGSLIKDVCRDQSLMKIRTLIPESIAGPYADTEVPLQLAFSQVHFACNFAEFLSQIEKFSLALPVFFFCHTQYVEYQTKKETVQAEKVETYVPENIQNITDDDMIRVYIGLLKIYERQGQLPFFRELMPQIHQVCKRKNTYGSLSFLQTAAQTVGDTATYDSATIERETAEKTEHCSYLFRLFKYWPYGCQI